MKLFDSELKVMNILWEKEPIPAKEVCIITNKTIGWNKNTTYTVLKKLIEKKVIQRTEPNFICTSIVKREEEQKAETQNLIDKFYKGSRKAFFAAFIQDTLSDNEVEELKKLIDKRAQNI